MKSCAVPHRTFNQAFDHVKKPLFFVMLNNGTRAQVHNSGKLDSAKEKSLTVHYIVLDTIHSVREPLVGRAWNLSPMDTGSSYRQYAMMRNGLTPSNGSNTEMDAEVLEFQGRHHDITCDSRLDSHMQFWMQFL